MFRNSATSLAFVAAAVFLLLAAGISAEVSPAASDLPSSQQVLAFLTETIDWYRERVIERQIGTEPGDLVFVEDNRPIAAQIVQLSFDFARADASIAEISAPGNQKASAAAASGASPDLEHFVQLENNANLAIQQATQEIETIKKKLQIAHGADRRNLQVALDAAGSRLELLQAGLSSLHEVVEFVRESGDRQTGDLQSKIDDLARRVPDATSPAGQRPHMPDYDVAAISKPRDSGILGLSSEVSALGRKLRILDDEIGRIIKLRKSCDDLRNPLLAYVTARLPAGASNYLQASDLRVLQQLKAQVDALKIMVRALAPAIVALDKRVVLLGSYSSHLKSWRAAVVSEDEGAWKRLILWMVVVAVVIGALIATGAVARKLTDRHVHDAERRHIFRVTERVVLWFTIALVVAFSLASDLASMATFLGLLTAGIAVALQSVIVSALGYFMLVGRHGIRLGDRVQITGMSGDVTDIGWLQFQVREIDKETQQPTGQVVTFPNSLALSSGGLGKFNREDLKLSQLGSGAKAPHS